MTRLLGVRDRGHDAGGVAVAGVRVDKECDDHGVFVKLKIYMNLTYDNGNTAFSRVTPNAGGCGNYKLGTYRRWDTGPGSADIKKVCARLTKDVPGGNDKPYKYTLDCVYS